MGTASPVERSTVRRHDECRAQQSWRENHAGEDSKRNPGPAKMTIVDDSMRVAFRLAKTIGVPPYPQWLGNIETCVKVVEGIERNGLQHKTDADHATIQMLTDKINVIFYTWAQNEESVPQVDDVLQRQNVLLRLWSGCTDTAKAIKYQTRDPEPTTPTQRRAWFDDTINPNCRECRIYQAGSLCAVAYMVGRGQEDELCFEGVPEQSAVLTQRPASKWTWLMT